MNNIEKSFEFAVERYADYGVNVARALEIVDQVAISLHCWQGDDVTGLENTGASLSGGIQATGNYPGKALNGDQLRTDIEEAIKAIPGALRLNLHSCYAERNGSKADRDEYTVDFFRRWIDWAKATDLKLDFNPSCFGHPMSADNLTLTNPDEGIRKFWINHCIASRQIAAAMGRELGSAAVNNIWIPDGYKDTPADRLAPRLRLMNSLDQIFAEEFSRGELLDAVEPKLFGIGSESYVAGSHEFYMGYAAKHNKLLCLDSGHFHPTETISDKISSVLCFIDEILLHVSRGVRWDSDHVITLTDDLQAIAGELVRHDFLPRVHVGLDYFDASINRIAAWVVGARNFRKALLIALLEPTSELRRMEEAGDYTSRLVMQEELKSLPWQAVWDYYCHKSNKPVGIEYLKNIKEYEKTVLSQR